MTGTRMVHVAYRGGAGAYADLIAGRADVYFPALTSARSYPQERRTAQRCRHRLLHRTIAADTWFGIGAPRNTPAAIVERLNREINAALTDPTLATRLADGGGTVVTGSPADFGKLIADETEKWAKVIKLSGTALS